MNITNHVTTPSETNQRVRRPLPTKSLAEIAADINEAHAECVERFRGGFDHAVKTGELLIEAKEAVKAAGNSWLAWLKENTQVPERTCQLYMALARHSGMIERESAIVADLTMNAADQLIRRAQSGPPEQTPCNREQLFEKAHRAMQRTGNIHDFFDWLRRNDKDFEKWCDGREELFRRALTNGGDPVTNPDGLATSVATFQSPKSGIRLRP